MVRNVVIGAAILAATMIGTQARAALIDGWGADTGATAGTVTDDGVSGFSTTAPTGNLAIRALMPSTLTLTNVGDQIVLSGQVALAAGDNGNQSLRLELLNTNGANSGTLSSGVWTGSTATGWLGYMAELPQIASAGGSEVLAHRASPNTGAWFSGTGASNLATKTASTIETGTPPNVAATYNFNLTLTLSAAATITESYTFADTDGSMSIGDSIADPAANEFAYNAVGFLENGSSGGAATWSNMAVNFIPAGTATPEPASAALLGLSSLGLLLRRRRAVA
jgi:PEP-CTERM motif